MEADPVVTRARAKWQRSDDLVIEVTGEIVRRERRWTLAGETPARELVRSTR